MKVNQRIKPKTESTGNNQRAQCRVVDDNDLQAVNGGTFWDPQPPEVPKDLGDRNLMGFGPGMPVFGSEPEL